MSSTKSTGHLLARRGRLVIFSTLAVAEDIVPPTFIYLIQNRLFTGWILCHFRQKRVMRNALSKFFGFGGTNASLSIGKAD